MAVSTQAPAAGSTTQTFLAQGNAAMRAGNYSQAVALFEQALKQSPALAKVIEFNLKLAKSKAGNASLETQLLESEALVVNKKPIVKAGSSLSAAKKLGPEKNTAMLRLENVTSRFATGWAIDKDEPSNTIVMTVDLDGKPYSIIETYLQRNDVQKAHGGDGFSGYRAELNAYTSYSKDTFVSVNPLSHVVPEAELKAAKKNLQPILKGIHYKDINTVAGKVSQNYVHDYDTTANNDIAISVVILNLNGEVVLKDCISSILQFNKAAEIIVVDHASTDNSVQMLEGFNNQRIKIIRRDKNYSYSESNNLGAAEASGDIVIFMNNDLILTSDAISVMADIVSKSEFGLLGIKLWDLPKSKQFELGEDIKVTQHLAVHFNGLNRAETIEAFEVRNTAFTNLDKGILETPAVTAAMLAISKQDFLAINGFSEKYFYGQEDVDLCLRFYKQIGKKTGVLLDHGAYHIRGLSRKSLSKSNKTYMADNRKTIQKELGAWFRREFRNGQFVKPGFWNQKPFSIAMVVSEVGFETDKADFFTAKELGDAFEQKDNIVVGYFDTKSDYDVTGYDVVIVYIDGFDPRRLKNVSPHCVVVGWARNWFDRWCDRVWVEHYDMLYASSELAQKYMSSKLKREVGLLRIAASNDCLKPLKAKKEFASDYVFTGSYFESPREITDALNPEAIPFKFKLFGHNWEKLPHFGKYSCGPVSYLDIPSVYASTRIVVDDANIATKKWGALNCRIYDALAAGIPCITNNEIGVKEIFGDDFPTYNVENLNSKITALLKSKDQLLNLASKYKDVVRAHHTYANRRDQLLADITSYVNKKKVAIKIAAPDFERGLTWGDYHFAAAVRNEMEKLGYAVRIDCMDQWYGDRSLNNDINLILRGLDRFKTRADQLNLLWIISHPDLVCEAELRDYQHIFVASELYADKLRKFTGMENISVLLQASSFNADKLDPEILAQTPEHDILFIGNSRNEYREVVKWCVEENLPIAVYGNGWEQFIPNELIHGTFVPNELIPYYYNKAKVVLNDHWPDMRRNGFISNRIFDIASVNGKYLSDFFVCSDEELKGKGYTYESEKDFKAKISDVLNFGFTIENRGVNSSFSFYERIGTLVSKVNRLQSPEKRTFKNYLSFGFNCEVSFALKALNLFQPTIFSWADIRGTDAFINLLEKPGEIFKAGYVQYSNNMFFDPELKVGFHSKLEFSTVSDLSEAEKVSAITDALVETQERISYLDKKTKNIIQSGSSLIVIKWISDVFDDGYSPKESAMRLADFLSKHFNSKNFEVLFLAEGLSDEKLISSLGIDVTLKGFSSFSPRSNASAINLDAWRNVLNSYI